MGRWDGEWVKWWYLDVLDRRVGAHVLGQAERLGQLLVERGVSRERVSVVRGEEGVEVIAVDGRVGGAVRVEPVGLGVDLVEVRGLKRRGGW